MTCNSCGALSVFVHVVKKHCWSKRPSWRSGEALRTLLLLPAGDRLLLGGEPEQEESEARAVQPSMARELLVCLSKMQSMHFSKAYFLLDSS